MGAKISNKGKGHMRSTNLALNVGHIISKRRKDLVDFIMRHIDLFALLPRIWWAFGQCPTTRTLSDRPLFIHNFNVSWCTFDIYVLKVWLGHFETRCKFYGYFIMELFSCWNAYIYVKCYISWKRIFFYEICLAVSKLVISLIFLYEMMKGIFIVYIATVQN